MTIPEDSNTSTQYDALVLDSGPLIRGDFPYNLAKVFYTIPDVLDEIKDEATRLRLKTPMFPLKIKQPSAEAMKLTRAFAADTGDLASLSATDLKVIALTLTLEMDANGERSQAITRPQELQVHQGEAFNDAAFSINTKSSRNKNKKKPVEMTESKTDVSEVKVEDEEDAGEWITPENVAQVKQSDPFSTTLKSDQPESTTDSAVKLIGCISTDFAIQNVLLQMRLKLFSTDGMRIRQVKNWLLRCHACYWTTRQMERRFCDRCGNNTLIRTSFIVDQQGQVHLFLKRNFQYNLRGTVYSMPMPKPGRDGNNLLLREDQKEYLQAMKTYERDQRKAAKNDEDALDDRLATVFGGMNIKGANKSFGGAKPTIGCGRRNPNAVKPKRG